MDCFVEVPHTVARTNLIMKQINKPKMTEKIHLFLKHSQNTSGSRGRDELRRKWKVGARGKNQIEKFFSSFIPLDIIKSRGRGSRKAGQFYKLFIFHSFIFSFSEKSAHNCWALVGMGKICLCMIIRFNIHRKRVGKKVLRGNDKGDSHFFSLSISLSFPFLGSKMEERPNALTMK
jgi:hypothetical protein